MLFSAKHNVPINLRSMAGLSLYDYALGCNRRCSGGGKTMRGVRQ
jgi:hypothetical protein